MKIIVATGGTGGHIFPALETAICLRRRGHEVIVAGALGLSEEKIKLLGFTTLPVKAKGLTGRSPADLWNFFTLMGTAIGQAWRNLKQVKPDKVLGFGGYGSFAFVLAARALNIPVMIHEQNVVPGKANRLLAWLVPKVAISFSKTKNYLPTLKVVLTGCPCHCHGLRDSRESLLKKFLLENTRRTILLLGGSQGSQKLNEVFFEMVSKWQGPPIQALHMTGIKDCAAYKAKYRNVSLPVSIFEFIHPVEEAYAMADIVVARAGAATVWELGFFGIPSILVPYPLAGGHQKYNAQVLVEAGTAKMIEQQDLTSQNLKDAVLSLLTSGQRKPIFHHNPAQALALAVENL